MYAVKIKSVPVLKIKSVPVLCPGFRISVFEREDQVKVSSILAIVLLVWMGNVFADYHFTNCHVVEIVSSGNVNNAHVRLDCAISPRPSCATAANWFGFDKSTDTGKQYLSLVSMAFSMNAVVTGTVNQTEGSCPAWQTNVSMLAHIRVKRQ